MNTRKWFFLLSLLFGIMVPLAAALAEGPPSPPPGMGGMGMPPSGKMPDQRKGLPSEEAVVAAKEKDAPLAAEARRVRDEVDGTAKAGPDDILILAKVPSRKELFRVNEIKEIPVERQIIFLVITGPKGEVLGVQEIWEGPKKDFQNTYGHYFDKKGNTLAFQRFSSFILRPRMSMDPQVVAETSDYFFDGKGRLIQKDYVLLSNGKAVDDPSALAFPYRLPYTIHKTWKEFAKERGVTKDLLAKKK